MGQQVSQRGQHVTPFGQHGKANWATSYITWVNIVGPMGQHIRVNGATNFPTYLNIVRSFGVQIISPSQQGKVNGAAITTPESTWFLLGNKLHHLGQHSVVSGGTRYHTYVYIVGSVGNTVSRPESKTANGATSYPTWINEVRSLG